MADSRIDELRRRLERDPESRLFAQLAEELRKAGELEEAINVARRGLERHPAYPSARLTLGRALLDSGDPASARAELETAARGAPDNILANRLLGEALESLGDLAGALRQYEATLQVAPGDPNIGARVQDLRSRLEGGGAAAEARSPEVTAPLAAVAPPRPPAAPGAVVARAPSPPTSADSGRAPEEEGDEGPPPTIRIRTPGEPPLPRRAAAPPGGGARSDVTRPGGAAAPSPSAPGEPGPPGRPGDEGSAGQVTPAQPPSPPGPESRQAPARAPEASALRPGGSSMEAPPREEPPTLSRRDAGPAPGAESGATGRGGESERPEVGGPTVDDDSDLAPTLPTAAPVPVEEELPPTLPPHGEPGPAEPEPPEPSGAEAPGTPFSSATLAELYFQQGLLERAVEVYRQVLDEEPGNARARQRLTEVETLVAAGTSSLPVPALDAGDDRAARRRALERTIELLEGLLAVLRRR